MAAKFPPHTFDAGPPIRWTFHAGGSVAHITGSKSVACERCLATAGTSIGHAPLAEFLRDHAGPTCNTNSAPAGATRKR